MNKKLFLLPFLTFSLALAGCSIHGEDKKDEPKAKEIWEEDLVEGESSIDQVKAGEAGKYYKVRGTVAANSGSTLALYRGGKFLYCYNFNSDSSAEGNGGQTKLEEHKLGSYVEIYAQSSEYTNSIQLTAYAVGESKTSRNYDEAAVLHKLADKGETVAPVAAAVAADFENGKAAGALLKVNFVPGKDFTFDAADTSGNQDLPGKVGDVDVTLRMEKFLPSDVRTALLDDAHKSFEMGATYELVALAAATSSGSCRLVVVEGASWKKTAEPQWDAPTSVLIEAEGEKKQIEVNEQLQLDFTVSPKTAKPAVTWSSSDDEIATVSEEGVVKGIAVGEADIFALAANSETVKGTYHIKVVAPSKTITLVTAPAVGTTYKMGINQVKDGVKYYLDGTMDSEKNYLANGNSDVEEAIDFELVAGSAEGKYKLKCTIGDATKYVNVTVSGKNVNFKYEDSASTEYEYNTKYNTLVFEVSGCSDSKKNGTNYFGSYGTSQDISASALTYLKEDMSNYETDGGQYPLHFYTVA